MKKSLKISILLFLIAFCGFQPVRAAHIKVITEKPVDENVLMDSIKKGGVAFGRNKLSAIEFTDTKGKIKRIDLQDGKPPKKGVENLADIRISENDKYAVISRKAHNSNERNPYVLRQSSATELVWYTADGDESGRRFFNQTSALKAISNDGLLTIIVDEGFDPETLTIYRDVPNLKSTERLKRDSNLTDHFLYVLSEKGETVITRRIKGPGSAPENIVFSPAGDWFIYSVGGKDSFVNNVKTKNEEKISLGFVGWRITDKGELYSWKPETKRGHWGEVNGERAWIQEKNVMYRLFVKRQGNTELIKTDQVGELNSEKKELEAPIYNSDGLIKEK